MFKTHIEDSNSWVEKQERYLSYCMGDNSQIRKPRWHARGMGLLRPACRASPWHPGGTCALARAFFSRRVIFPLPLRMRTGQGFPGRPAGCPCGTEAALAHSPCLLWLQRDPCFPGSPATHGGCPALPHGRTVTPPQFPLPSCCPSTTCIKTNKTKPHARAIVGPFTGASMWLAPGDSAAILEVPRVPPF